MLRRSLSGLAAGADVFELAESVADLHPKNGTFPGEVFMRLAADGSASVRGGLEPDLLDEVIWWRTDDYWRYPLYAAVALIRAGAERQGASVARLAHQLAEQHGIALT